MLKIKSFLMILVAAVLSGCVTDREEDAVSLGVGERCPDFSVELTDGSVVSAASLRGETTLICFFNTECGDCRRELPVVQQAYETLTSERDGVAPQFVCIARDEDEAPILKFWNDNRLTLPVSAQPDASVYRLFANLGIPRIYIVSPEGVITATWSDNPSATADQIVAAFH